MGFWGKIFDNNRPSKNDLIRSLVKNRIREDPFSSAMGLNEQMVDSLGMLQLAGLPESTIATIVQTFVMLKKNSIHEYEIFSQIEKHRSSIGAGDMPNPLDLKSYIKYRIELEHGHGTPISDEFMINATHVCRQHFECK